MVTPSAKLGEYANESAKTSYVCSVKKKRKKSTSMNITVNQNYAGHLSICPIVLSGSEELDTEPFR